MISTIVIKLLWCEQISGRVDDVYYERGLYILAKVSVDRELDRNYRNVMFSETTWF